WSVTGVQTCALPIYPQARDMSANLRPLEEAAVDRLKTWLPKLSHPVRIGEHDQTAFGLGLRLDYARATGNEEFAKLVSDSAKKRSEERRVGKESRWR